MEKSLIQPAGLGAFGEEEACRFLQKKGCKVVERNYRASGGEIDIIARNGKVVIFAEVKTRSSSNFARPWEAVGYRKRKNLKSAAREYLREHPMRGYEFRFDVVSIVVDDAMKAEVEWIQSAF